MIMVVGGAFQGKRQALQRLMKVSEQEFEKLISQQQVILDCEKTIESWLEDGVDALEIFNRLTRLHIKGVTLAEVGMGVVPMEKKMRVYRDTVGMVGQLLAKEAKEVYRVTCGVEMKLK